MVWIISNSPGEIYTWVHSIVEQIKSFSRQIRVVLLLVPCPFASGDEERVAQNRDLFDLVIPAREFFPFLFSTRRFYSKGGVVVFLGGDYWHPLLVAKKVRLPLIGYATKSSYWLKFFNYIMVPDKATGELLISSGIPKEKLEVIGNLLLSAIKFKYTSCYEFLKYFSVSYDNPKVGLIPGSRRTILVHSLPYLLAVAEKINSMQPEAEFFIPLSPLLKVEDLLKVFSVSNLERKTEWVDAKLYVDKKEGQFLLTPNNIKVRLFTEARYDVLQAMDLILTIPGTITAEAGALGVPMIVFYSLKITKDLPIGGLAGVLGRTPLLGNLLKSAVIFWKSKKKKFVSHPNIIAKKQIVPEIKVNYLAEELANPAVELLCHPERREKISLRLKRLFPLNNASQILANKILSIVNNA